MCDMVKLCQFCGDFETGVVGRCRCCEGRGVLASHSMSSPRKQGPIATGRSLARVRRSVLRPSTIDRFRGMGPCVRRDDPGRDRYV
ncbi:hypothetical protein CDS [Bradyrhizobium sp.]|nr:hypothetical protein CDS [Bradyrhizobium sp.]